MSNACIGAVRSLVHGFGGRSVLRTSLHGCFAAARPSLFGLFTVENHGICTWTLSARRSLHQSSQSLAKAPRKGRKTNPPGPRSATKESTAQLNANELARIFGQQIGPEKGNRILQVLQDRRTSGSLVELGVKIDQSEGLDATDKALVRGLSWLRQQYPVDEQAAATKYATEEARRLELSDPTARGPATASRPQTSVIDDFKRYHAERRKREEEEEKLKPPPEPKALPPAVIEAQRQKELRTARNQEWKEYYYEKAKLTSGDRVPEMSLVQRLGPATLLGALLLTGCYFLAEVYTPPSQARRVFPDTPTSIATIGGIFATWTAVYCMWYFPPTQRFLNKYFIQTVALPYAFSVFGNTLSHQKFMHMAANMVAFAAYGISVHEDIGRGNFLALVFAGGIVGSLSSLYFHVLTNRLTISSLGASGGSWAIAMAWSSLNLSKPAKPTDSFGFAADVALHASIAIQVIAHANPGVRAAVDTCSHVGGAAVGVLAAQAIKRRAKARQDGGQQGGGAGGSEAERKMEELKKKNSTARFVRSV